MKLWILIAFLCGPVCAVDVTVEVGQDATLQCSLPGNFPEWFGPPNMTPLTSSNQVTAEGMEYANNKDLRILNVTTSQAGDYKCKANNVEETVKLVVNSFDYGVEIVGVRDDVVPYEPTTRVLPANNNTEFELKCIVTNAFPEPQVTMEILGTSLNLNVITTSTMEQSNTYTVVAVANVSIIPDLDMKSVVCNATSGDRFSDMTETLRVIYRPLLQVYSSSGSLYPEKNSGDFECTTYKVWPMAGYTWSVNGSSLPENFKVNQTRSKCTQDSLTRLYDCTSVLEFENMMKEYNGLDVSCDVVFLGSSKKAHDFPVEFLFPPTMATIEDTGPIYAKEGENVTLTCSTDSSNVLRRDTATQKYIHVSGVTFSWKVGSEELDVRVVDEADSPSSYNGFKATQTVSFMTTKDMNGQTATCQAKNFYQPSDTYVEDMSTPLNISYKPTFVLLFPLLHVYQGDNLDLMCKVESNPGSTLTWSHMGVNLESSVNRATNSLTYSITSASMQNAGIYNCAADNDEFSPTVGTTKVVVLEKPPLPTVSVSATDTTSAIFGTSVTAPDIPRSFYVQYKVSSSAVWLELNQAIPDTMEGQTSRQVEVPLTNLLPGTMYDVRVKSVDQYGLSVYSMKESFLTEEAEEMKTKKQYRNAILVSVFVTFGIMLIVVVIVICLAKSGKCGSSSVTRSKSDFVAM